MPFIRTLDDLDRNDLALAGGKAANLGALVRAGFPVPPGFCITTEAYRAFVADNALDEDLRRILDSARMDEPARLASAADQIQAHFCSGRIPAALAEEIGQAYAALANPQPAVAVRSSATAEDLPDLSFAGQQDTFLNVMGKEALLQAVVRCMASLWTERAIAYRVRNDIPSENIALAVIVQQMVQSEASGVLFTANPLTGKRSESVIDATFGLGEALVSGRVEPDAYVVDTAGRRILSKKLGAKAIVTRGQDGGGTVTLPQDASAQQALPDEQILALARLGQQAAAHFGSPQDMEWAWAGGRMYVVQSRPVTSLYPLPAHSASDPLETWLSFGVWQGMLDPYAPAGQDILISVVAGLARIFGIRLKTEEQRIMLPAGERLFVNLSGLFRSSPGRKVLKVFVSSIDPISGELLGCLLENPALPGPGKMTLRNVIRLGRGLFPLLGNVIFNLLWPARGRARLQKKIEEQLALAQSRYSASKNSLTGLADAIGTTAILQTKEIMPPLIAGVIAGQAPLQILIRSVADIPGCPELVLELTRGLPYNVTTEMDLALWEAAQILRAHPAEAAHFSETSAGELVSTYRTGSLPPATQAAIAGFLKTYGMRGIGEIDLGRARWNDDPTHIFQVLKSYLEIDQTKSPAAIFRNGAERAKRARQELITACLRTKSGLLKASFAKIMTTRLRELGGLRETPKFMVVRLLGLMRAALLAAGQELVETDTLRRAEDAFFLHLDELKALEDVPGDHWKALVEERRSTYERELRRKRVPRILLSDGTVLFDTPVSSNDGDENTLIGSPVSAGVVEGVVRVVFDPQEGQLAPGEVLVCPATDPAWTPLFLAAGGLVMEVGGMMTHGSVVAREYGIPAVVGVRQATERLRTGQRVRVDGSTGKVTMLDAAEG